VNTTLLHRRRVERFAQLLDEAEGARRHHSRSAIDDELNDLLTVGYLLGDIKPQIKISEARREKTRLDLMAYAGKHGIGVTAKPEKPSAVGRARVGAVTTTSIAPRPFARRVRARGAILVGLAVGTLAISGIATASGDAMPGNPLYGLKRSQETAQLALAGSPVNNGQLYLSFASKRLSEALGSANAKQFGSLLADMDTETQDGALLLLTYAITHHDQRALRTVVDFSARQHTQINGILGDMSRDDPRRDYLLQSRTLLDKVDLRSDAVSAGIDCPGEHVIGSYPYGPILAQCTPPTGTGTPSGP
jgi:hypothetical protein